MILKDLKNWLYHWHACCQVMAGCCLGKEGFDAVREHKSESRRALRKIDALISKKPPSVTPEWIENKIEEYLLKYGAAPLQSLSEYILTEAGVDLQYPQDPKAKP